MRDTAPTTSTKTPTRFQVWYEENKTKISRKRRKRYKADPKYRERVLEYTRSYREAKRKTAKPRPGYSVTEAAVLIGRTAQTIRDWEKRKLIPRVRDERGYRRYTKQQVSLLKTMGKVLDDHRYRRASRQKVIATRAVVRENWNAGKVR